MELSSSLQTFPLNVSRLNIRTTVHTTSYNSLAYFGSGFFTVCQSTLNKSTSICLLKVLLDFEHKHIG